MSYLLANQASELERLQAQSRVWEPAGHRLLTRLGGGEGLRVLDVGCGAMGWLRVLSQWVGPHGRVFGADVDDAMLHAASALCASDDLANVELVRDDFFATSLQPASFDLVHLRFQIAPLGRAIEQVDVARGLLKRGGILVLEDPDTSSWRENPISPAADRVRALIIESFARAGGDFDAGRRLPEYLRGAGIDPSIAAEVVALEPGHPYLQLPVQFATSLRSRLLGLVAAAELDHLLESARRELADPARWGATFTLIQAWGRLP